MGRSHHPGSLRGKKNVNEYPEIFIDKEADFASIKIASGVERRSYVKDGFVVCEDRRGNIIEIQLLNLTSLLSSGKRLAA